MISTVAGIIVAIIPYTVGAIIGFIMRGLAVVVAAFEEGYSTGRGG